VCRHAEIALESNRTAARTARRFLTARLQEWELPDLEVDVGLATSELVTNAYLHAEPPLSLSVDCSAGMLEICVRDGSHQEPVVRPERSDPTEDLELAVALLRRGPAGRDDRDPALSVGESGPIVAGRGLLLLGSVAESWGVTPTEEGKAVWFRLPVRGACAPGADCPCSGSPGSRTLASGSPVHY